MTWELYRFTPAQGKSFLMRVNASLSQIYLTSREFKATTPNPAQEFSDFLTGKGIDHELMSPSMEISLA